MKTLKEIGPLGQREKYLTSAQALLTGRFGLIREFWTVKRISLGTIMPARFEKISIKKINKKNI